MRIKFKSYGEEYEGYLVVQHYGNNNNIAVSIVLPTGEPYGFLTVNIDSLDEDEAAIDTNNFPEAEEIINQYHLAENTGKVLASGYCKYPVYKFNVSTVNKYCIE